MECEVREKTGNVGDIGLQLQSWDKGHNSVRNKVTTIMCTVCLARAHSQQASSLCGPKDSIVKSVS